MADRKVTCSGKDSDGDITSIGNPGEYWSPRNKLAAINDIESGLHTYYIQSSSGRVEIHVVNGASGKYLRAGPDDSSANNLDNLSDCQISSGILDWSLFNNFSNVVISCE